MSGLSGLCWAVWKMFMAYLSQLCSQKSTFEVLLRPALGPCWATSGLKMKHEKGMGFHVSFVGLLLVMSKQIWAFLGLCWAVWRMFMAYLSQLCSRKSMGFLCVMLGPFGSLWAYVGQFGGCSWPILANFVARKAPLRSCWGRPWGHVGLPQGSKWSMKTGYGVSCFICWALVGHVETNLGLSGLMLGSLEDVHGLS